MKISSKLLIILTTNLFLFILVFVFIEAVFRVVGIPYKTNWIPNENLFAKYDPELGWSYIPYKSTMLKAGDIEKPVHFDINGIRVPHANFKFDSSQPSILFIGDSFTFGHGLSYEESFIGKVAALKEMPYQVVNLGVQGYGSDQAFLALKRYIPKFNTKVVVYAFIEDHILRNGNYDRRMLLPNARFVGTKPIFSLDSGQKLTLARKPVLYKDYINSFLIDFLKIRIGSIAGTFPPYPEDLTRAIILEMKKLCDEYGARFVVINWRWNNNDYNKLFQELDADIIDTLEDAPDNWEKLVLLEGIHPNEHAGDHIAQLLLKYLISKGLIQ